MKVGDRLNKHIEIILVFLDSQKLLSYSQYVQNISRRLMLLLDSRPFLIKNLSNEHVKLLTKQAGLRVTFVTFKVL